VAPFVIAVVSRVVSISAYTFVISFEVQKERSLRTHTLLRSPDIKGHCNTGVENLTVQHTSPCPKRVITLLCYQLSVELSTLKHNRPYA